MWTLASSLVGCTPPVSDGPVGREPVVDATETAAPPEPALDPPNLLLVVIDDVGVDKIAAYGESPTAPPTPTLSSLAAEGVLFRNAWATPICGLSRGWLLTGRYGRRYGMGENIAFTSDWRIPTTEQLLPELLAAAPAPYTSAALGKWHLAGAGGDLLGFMSDPLDRGFAHATGTPSNVLSYFTWTDATDGVLSVRSGYLTTATADDAIGSIATLPEPWFVYLAFNAPHAPVHVPPDPLDLAGITELDLPVAKYDAILQALDAELGRVLEAIGPEVRERTTIVAMGDNGTPGFATTAPFSRAFSKGTLMEGGVNVPMIVAGAGVEAPGTESPALVSIVDVAATFLDLAGADATGVTLDGVSFRAQLRDPDATGRAFTYTEHLRHNGPPPWPFETQAVRGARHKLVRFQDADLLYDLQDRHDDGPNLLERDLTAEEQEAYDALRAELDRVVAAAVYDGP